MQGSVDRSNTPAQRRRFIIIVGICVLVIVIWVASVLLFIKPALKRAQSEKVVGSSRDMTSRVDMHTVTSTAGFSFRYDANALYVNGQTIDAVSPDGVIRGQEYDDPEELETSRRYSVVMIELPDDGTTETYLHMPRMTMVASVRIESLKDYAALPENQGLSELDLFAKHMTAKELENDTERSLQRQPQSVTINNVQYKKIIFEQDDGLYKSIDEQYVTVQHGQGFIIKISNIDRKNQYQLPLFRQVLKTISFPTPQ